MKPKYDILLPIVALSLMISAVCGCGKSEKEEAVVDRTQDSEYQDALTRQAAKRDKLLKERVPAVARLEELKKAGVVEGEEVEKLKAEIEKSNREIEKNRLENQALVRARILKEVADRKKISDKTSK